MPTCLRIWPSPNSLNFFVEVGYGVLHLLHCINIHWVLGGDFGKLALHLRRIAIACLTSFLDIFESVLHGKGASPSKEPKSVFKIKFGGLLHHHQLVTSVC